MNNCKVCDDDGLNCNICGFDPSKSSASPDCSAAIDELVASANSVAAYCGAHGAICSNHPAMVRMLNVLDDNWPV